MGPIPRVWSTMLLAAILVGSIYVCATGKITNKISAIETLRNIWEGLRSFIHKPAQAELEPPFLFATTFPLVDSRLDGWNSVHALIMEILQGVPLRRHHPRPCFGFWWSFADLRPPTGLWALDHLQRHARLDSGRARDVGRLCFGSPCDDLGDGRIVLSWSWVCKESCRGRILTLAANGAERTATDVVVPLRSRVVDAVLRDLILACLPKGDATAARQSRRQSSSRLMACQHLKIGDHVEDDHSWSAYFSGYVLKEGEVPVLKEGSVPTTCVVTLPVRASGDRPQTTQCRNPQGLVYHWPPRRISQSARRHLFAATRFEAESVDAP